MGGCLPHAGEGSTRFLAAPPRARLLSEDPGAYVCAVFTKRPLAPHIGQPQQTLPLLADDVARGK